MKMKIRGLVFVGFAAAVFAQSAMAGIDLNATQDPKTVTSKKYVDDKIPATATMNYGGSNHTNESTDGAVVLGNGRGEVKFTKLSNNSADVNSTAGENVVVTGKAVADALGSVANIDGDNVYTDVNEVNIGTEQAPNMIKQVQLTQTPASTAGAITTGTATGNEATTLVTAAAVRSAIQTSVSSASTDTQIPTAKAVFDYAEATANKLEYDTTETITAAATATTNNTSNVTFPTTKNVYEFVTSQVDGAAYQRKLTADDTGTLYIGQYDANASGDKSTWKELSVANASGQNPALASTNYVAKTVSGNVYTVNLDAAQIADSIATDASQKLVTENAVYDLVDRESTAGTSTIGSQSTTLVPTSKNVYDFVTTYAADNYQPIIDTARANKIMIGYNTATTNGGNTTYSSDWKELVGDYVYQNSTDVGYIQVDVNSEATGRVEVRLQNVGHAGSVISSATSSDVTNGTDKLASAYAVQQYVSTMMGGLEIPPMSDACTTAIALNNGHYCALVAGYDATDGVKLEWTVMAPTE